MRSIKKFLLVFISILLLSGCTFKNTNDMSIDKEGNVGGTSDMSRTQKAKIRKVVQRKYPKNSLHLYGYGVPKY